MLPLATRGNKVQQAYICASVVKRLQEVEAVGTLTGKVRIMVIPEVNSFSMNIAYRFWPMDNTDISRMFPGYDLGETTQRLSTPLSLTTTGRFGEPGHHRLQDCPAIG